MENCNPFPFNLTLVKRLRDEKHNCGVQILQKTVSSRQPVVFDTFQVYLLKGSRNPFHGFHETLLFCFISMLRLQSAWR